MGRLSVHCVIPQLNGRDLQGWPGGLPSSLTILGILRTSKWPTAACPWTALETRLCHCPGAAVWGSGKPRHLEHLSMLGQVPQSSREITASISEDTEVGALFDKMSGQRKHTLVERTGVSLR